MNFGRIDPKNEYTNGIILSHHLEHKYYPRRCAWVEEKLFEQPKEQHPKLIAGIQDLSKYRRKEENRETLHKM